MKRLLGKSRKLTLVACFSPALFGILLLVPRLASPQFGLLDDGVTIHVARQVMEHFDLALRVNSTTGRFLPAYWLYETALYAIGWAQPVVFYAANAILLALTVSLLIILVLLRGGDRVQAWASGMCFLLSGPVIENFYTLSKAEPLQLFALLAGLVLLLLMVRTPVRLRRAVSFTGVVIAFLLACCIKETAVVLLPITVGWLAIGFLPIGDKDDRMDRMAREICCFVAVISIATYFFLRSVGAPAAISGGTYTQNYKVDPSRLLGSLSTWAAWLFRDFPYVFPLSCFVTWSLVWKKQRQHARILVDAFIWMGGWLLIFLPWQSTLEYYLLPFAAGCAIFCGVAAGELLTRSREHNAPYWLKFVIPCSVVLLVLTQVNNATAARFQLAVDGANADLVEFLAHLPKGSKILVNLPEPNEYVYEIGLQLAELKGRPDLRVGYFHLDVASPENPALSYYVATPVLENQTTPTPRYAVYESGANAWGRAFAAFAGEHTALVHSDTRSIDLLDFGLQRLLCPFVRAGGLYCSAPRPLVDTRTLSQGWKVYRISSRISEVDLPASFGTDGVWAFRMSSGATRVLRFGQPGDIPVVGDWDGDRGTDIGIFRPSTLTWYLDRNFDGKTDSQFQFPDMQAGDIPIVGDWDGDHRSTPGYFRPSDVSWHFRNGFENGGEDWRIIRLGLPGDIPLVGDWAGGGRTSVGIYRRSTGAIELANDLSSTPELTTFNVGANNAVVVGDWGGFGPDSIAVVAGPNWSRKVNCGCNPSNSPAVFTFSIGEGIPLAGKWRIR